MKLPAALQVLTWLSLGILLIKCAGTTTDEVPVSKNEKTPLFRLIHPLQSGLDFTNTLKEGLNTNILMYEYFYNGGGVATADFNGDGLIDIYLTSNMGQNKLFLNQGGLKFKDVTALSGAEGRSGPWKTGVTFADVNGDGRVDIYVCYSGTVKDPGRANQLFINQGNGVDDIPHFNDEAERYGIASTGYSNHACFFDYDRDGDLDMFLLNHNPESMPVLNEVSTREMLKKDDPLRGSRLYRQHNGKFQDVTSKSGINGSALSYGLGVAVSDVNGDGWPDIYVSNDYAIPDYLYINNGDGTFTDRIQEMFRYTSHFSMGSDVADVNNDGMPDVMTLDMLPEDNARQKLLMSPDNYAKFDLNVRSGFYYQYMRNMLHLNNGNGTFSEVGQFFNVSNTDWSWAALLGDYDNDGRKDLLVTNGYLRDYTNLDFIKYMDDFVKTKGRLKREDVIEIIRHMPASNVSNYVFANRNGNSFENMTSEWGLHMPSNSNGAAYADLDNDGDLDLVVNNINQPVFLFENRSESFTPDAFLQVELAGKGMNTMGVGAKVELWTEGLVQMCEQMPSRGYLSAVSPVIHFGTGSSATVDSIRITWPSHQTQLLRDISTGQRILLKESDASKRTLPKRLEMPTFQQTKSPIDYQHISTMPNDFKRQPLMLSQPSYSGPCLVKGDLNMDGLEDIFAGGGAGEPSSVFIQQRNGSYSKFIHPVFY